LLEQRLTGLDDQLGRGTWRVAPRPALVAQHRHKEYIQGTAVQCSQRRRDGTETHTQGGRCSYRKALAKA
jgi:hypothetical protein